MESNNSQPPSHASHESRSLSRSPSEFRLTLLAGGLGFFSVMAALVLGYLFYCEALEREKTLHHGHFLNTARTLVAAAQLRGAQASNEVFLDTLESVWRAGGNLPPDE